VATTLVCVVPAIVSCSASVNMRSISEPALEIAPEAATRDLGRAVVTNPAPLQRLFQPLGQRMGICQIRTPADWDALRRAIPALGPAPDLSHGAAIAVISRAGQPLNGNWPVSVDSVRVSQGGGYVSANFEGGTYLPDGSNYVQIEHVYGMTDVLIVDVNGVRFYP
jgi:hypothetical protein